MKFWGLFLASVCATIPEYNMNNILKLNDQDRQYLNRWGISRGIIAKCPYDIIEGFIW